MSAWSADELERVGEAIELELATRRADGVLPLGHVTGPAARPVTIRLVRSEP